MERLMVPVNQPSGPALCEVPSRPTCAETVMNLTFDDSRHFRARMGFGGNPDEIRQLMRLDRAAAVAQALAIPTTTSRTPPPPWVDRLPPPPQQRKRWSENERKSFREARREEGLELKSWWYRELLTTRSRWWNA